MAEDRANACDGDERPYDEAMSDMTPGDWIIVSSVEEGDVGITRLEKICRYDADDADSPLVYIMNDRTVWSAINGTPLMRSCKGCSIRRAAAEEITTKCIALLTGKSYTIDVIAPIYNKLLFL